MRRSRPWTAHRARPRRCSSTPRRSTSKCTSRRSPSTTARLHEDLAARLVARLVLTPDEETTLDGDVSLAYFAAMDRLQHILDESLLLIDSTSDAAPGTIPDDARATHDVRARASARLDAAYRRVAHFASAAMRRLPLEGAESSALLREALARLAHREDLFRGALAAFAETRAASLPDAFVRALTVGGGPPSYLPRPIEMHAHDAARYVADILAWVHQLLANERELVATLLLRLAPPSSAPGTPRLGHRRRIGERHGGLDFSVDLGGAGPLLRPGQATLDGPVLDALVRSLLDRNVAGCCRPMKTRILQTLKAQTDAVVVLRLYFLLRFYASTMQQTIGARAALSKTLAELMQVGEDAFLHALQQLYDEHLGTLHGPGRDALAAVHAAARLVHSVLAECAQAREADVGTGDVRALEQHVLAHFVDPVVARVMALGAQPPEAPAQDGWGRYLRWGAAPNAPQHVCDTHEWHADVFYVNALVPLWVRACANAAIPAAVRGRGERAVRLDPRPCNECARAPLRPPRTSRCSPSTRRS